ncbi:hypothetical protein BDM02DRAFT_3127473 [Thelephora ganbajun]|uniref:Uncharacterized protein n=1 Tax=Thelephora ganbajun TaxID=370292 RepID=A0ACB6ZMZ8_THEGA|nr:hypothetical protein BDM02DRAFT_3127473 [Thelephora ganbajun]
MLRLSHVRISWTAPLLRNLTKLMLNFICTGTPHDSTSIQTFLNALKNCPDLESLQLAFAGPDLPDDSQGDSKVVVRLRKLQVLVLQFDDQKVVECIPSHIWFPESTKVEAETSCRAGLHAAISKVLPLVTDNFHFVLLHLHNEGESHRFNMDASPQFASKVVKIIGSDTAVTFHVLLGLPYEIPRRMWKGFHHLEEISYAASFRSDSDSVDPFFSLWDLKIPWVFTQGHSTVALKRGLLERDACGRQLKRISLSHPVEDEILVLRPFKRCCRRGRQVPESPLMVFLIFGSSSHKMSSLVATPDLKRDSGSDATTLSQHDRRVGAGVMSGRGS